MSSSFASSNTTVTTDDDKEVALLNKDIAEMYDESTDFLENIWGDHIHHGFYDVGKNHENVPLKSALIRVVEESLRFAGLSGKKPERIVDVGCGIGGSTRFIGKKFGATTIGITISPVQVQRAQAISAAQGLDDLVTFQVGDALNLSLPDGHFDVVWSMECGEHITDKAKYTSELVRVAAPGGTIILTALCHRDLGLDEKSLKPDEMGMLEGLGKSLHIDWCSAADYVKLFESLNVQDIKRADWSANIKPFWPAVFSTPVTLDSVISLLRSGPKSHEFVSNMSLMYEAHKKDLIKYNIITCKKLE